MSLGVDPYCDYRSQASSWHTQLGLRYKANPIAHCPADDFALSEPERFPQLQGKVQVSGHKLSDPQHSQYPSSWYEIRCYAPGPQGEVRALNFQQLLASQKRPLQMEFHFPIRPDTGTAWKSGQGNARVAPKDHSLQIDSMDMHYSRHDSVNQMYFQQLSQIGEVEQFRMRGLVNDFEMAPAIKELNEAHCNNLQMHPYQGHAQVWVEDYSEQLLDGTRLLPGHFQAGGQTLEQALMAARQARFEPEGLDGDYLRQGAVELYGRNGQGGALGLVHGERVRQSKSYVEGGNLLSGTRADGSPYVLIGQDSFDLTRAKLTAELGKTATEVEVRQALASDYGVLPDQVFGVEQPGAFHLDMRMTPIAPGVIALQDSRQAAHLQAGWMREAPDRQDNPLDENHFDHLFQDAERMARYEALTRRDLEKAGLKVVPIAGAFRDLQDLDTDGANFFNARHGTNPQGEKYTIMMGGTQEEEAYLAQTLLGEGHLAADRLYFLDPEQNQATLPLSGGLKCRTKPHGRLVQ
jgi:hypothetical protein